MHSISRYWDVPFLFCEKDKMRSLGGWLLNIVKKRTEYSMDFIQSYSASWILTCEEEEKPLENRSSSGY